MVVGEEMVWRLIGEVRVKIGVWGIVRVSDLKRRLSGGMIVNW